MISIDSIRDPDLSDSIINTLVFRLDDYLYPLNDFTTYHLATKNNAYLRSFARDNPTNQCSVTLYQTFIASMPVSQIEIARSWRSNQAESFDYFYIGSKNGLKNTFFYDYLPSAFDYIFTYFITNLYIKQIGSGLGSAFLFDTSKFRAFETPVQDLVSYTSSINNIVTSIEGLQSDRDYLLQIVEVQKSQIQSLHQQIDELNKKIYYQSQMTWR